MRRRPEVLTSFRKPTQFEIEEAERQKRKRLIDLGKAMLGLGWLIWLIRSWLAGA